MLPFVGLQPSSIPAGTLEMSEVKFNPSSKAALVGGVHLWCDIRDCDYLELELNIPSVANRRAIQQLQQRWWGKGIQQLL